MLKSVKCNLCGSDQYSVVYKTYEGDISTIYLDNYTITDNRRNMPLRIVKCAKCGLIYANPRPPVKSLISSYSKMEDAAYLEEEKARRLSVQSMLNQLQRLKKHGRLLDVGCATGFLLDEARKRGWEVFGIELSKWSVDHARNQLGLTNVLQTILKNAQYPSNYFDTVVLVDAIEHLTDPKGTLIEIRRILKSDGIIFVNTPDISSLVSKILRSRWWGVKQAHLYYFTRKSLGNMLVEAGFTPIKTGTHARTFSLKYWVTKIKDYNERLYRLCKFLIRNNIKNRLVRINLGDQIEVYGRKIRKLKYLEELEEPSYFLESKMMKVIVVLPAYNAAKTLKQTVQDIPKDSVNDIILVDDVSRDATVKIAKSLGLKVFVHPENKGYGANQKTCFSKAVEAGADIVVMVHPDYQYDPKVIPQLVEPIKKGKADAVFGSRMMKGGALEGGMPAWKHNANILLTALENVIFGTYLSEYHSGFRAYSGKVLESINFQLNSNGFIFDTEIIAQVLLHNFKIEEIPIRTRYFDEASIIKFWPSVIYGLGILKTLLKYILHTHTFIKFKQFE
jgi:2-polyprenyl-3-methyl-5-hydroxy-6-metoxy-1,4-benzoquinol methylase